MHPAIGPPVTMPAVLLGMQIMTHADTTRLLPLPRAGVYDPTMSECLILDGFDKLAYPHYGGFIIIPHQGTTSNPHDFIIMYFQKITW